MFNTSKFPCPKSLLIALMLAASGSAQNANVFASEGIHFEYPGDWKVVDKSTPQLIVLNLVPQSGNVLIVISVYRKKMSSPDEFESLKGDISAPRMYRLFRDFAERQEADVCLDSWKTHLPGTKMSGKLHNANSTAEDYSLALNDRYLDLLYLKEDSESSRSDPVWRQLLDTLSIGGKYAEMKATADKETEGFLNGRAIKLPRPMIPSNRGSAPGKISVEVRVIVDETGKVISAKPFGFNDYYNAAAAQAAKDARFEPSFACGAPTKVSGKIKYIFELY